MTLGLDQHRLNNRNPIDNMVRGNERIRAGIQATNDCCSPEGRTGAVAGAMIGTGVGVFIPPVGVWCLVTTPVGALVGWLVGEARGNPPRNQHRQ